MNNTTRKEKNSYSKNRKWIEKFKTWINNSESNNDNDELFDICYE